MPLNIKNEQAHALARELAELTDTSITDAVTSALQDAVERRKIRKLRNRNALFSELQDIAEFTAALPVHDERSAEEIIGYNERGIAE
ncbi:MAG: type II toxin-antitoxin system VapB family antitoxin [Spirochaetaceae bacterium]|nr:type II toxin-antitoxin system VapB family antitoxin [Spirochaetaceae bacterium]MCF7948144.1 type II toxin-antitoxin system VapB family antitoxin [Spirochaetia bacterium]MCF7950792.1 type II toxin-antitoxin system VapB family antitoxin [Spirochaetaceae bacterium]